MSHVEQVANKAAYVFPHADVVLHALITIGNQKGIHPWGICQGMVRRPALMYWVSGVTESLHYSSMRLIIAKLMNTYGVVFDADGYSAPHQPHIRVHGCSVPAITANPSSLG